MVGGLEEKLDALQISAVERAVEVIEDDEVGDTDVKGWLLACRVLTDKKFNLKAFIRAMEVAWSLSRRIVVNPVGENVFVIDFSHKGDRGYVLKNGPWSFDGHAIILVEFDGDARVEDIAFDRLPIWIRVFNLPINKMNMRVAIVIGDKVGRFVEADVDDNGRKIGRYLRIRVELDVTKPLRRGVVLKFGDKGIEDWFPFQYERLPDFYYICGRLDHVERDCLEENPDGKKTGYDSSLRAPGGRSFGSKPSSFSSTQASFGSGGGGTSVI
ncbi:hypothetical protein Droror1_Dr00015953 [Drosera rotundifolia]